MVFLNHVVKNSRPAIVVKSEAPTERVERPAPVEEPVEDRPRKGRKAKAE